MLYERIKLESDERVLRTIRKHWWVLFTRIVSVIFLAAAPLLAITAISAAFANASSLDFSFADTLARYHSEVTFGYLVWLLICWMLVANHLTDYYLDLWTITDRRIVSIDQRGFFSRVLSSFRLERLQDMNIEVTGIIPTLLNFGTVEAQTAGGNHEEFKTRNLPDPRGIKALITEAADARQKATAAMHHTTDHTGV